MRRSAPVHCTKWSYVGLLVNPLSGSDVLVDTSVVIPLWLGSDTECELRQDPNTLSGLMNKRLEEGLTHSTQFALDLSAATGAEPRRCCGTSGFALASRIHPETYIGLMH